jgi:hypothetical protein
METDTAHQTTAKEKANEPLTSHVLLGLGLYVIETRDRNRDKDLGPWKPACAFVSEHEAEWYHGRFESIGYMRILRPNAEVCQPEGEKRS